MKIKRLLFSLFFFFVAAANAQTLTSSVDRSSVAEGETLNLILTTDQRTNNFNPDPSPLIQDFEIIGTAKSSELNVVDNKTKAQTHWIFTLLPKRTGVLTIPILQVGPLQSQAHTVEVTAAVKSNRAFSSKIPRVFLETSATPTDPYIQAEIIYIVRVFTQDNIQAGTLTDPSLPNAIVTRLGNDTNYQTKRNGQTYGVVERHYVIFPQQNGTMTIVAPVLKGELVETTSSSNGLGGFLLANTTPIRVTTSATTLQVRAKPASYTANSWLPAQQVTLTETWAENPPQFHVGEPLTRILTLSATGLTGEQLPALNSQASTGIQTYSTPPAIKTSHDAKHVQGSRIEKIALIPSQEGEITLPAITLHWWNTQTHHEETATLSAHKMIVLPTKGQALKSVSSANIMPVSSSGATLPAATKALPVSPSQEIYWHWITAALLAVWLVTLLAWWGQKYLARAKISAFTNLWSCNDRIKYAQTPQETKKALLTWAAQLWPDKAISTLGEVIEQLADSPLKDAIKVLDKTLYAEKATHWNAETFWHIFKTYAPTSASSDKNPHKDPLPPLHPLK